MEKNCAHTLYFTAGALFAITATINFIDSKILLGFNYICLAITFILLGFSCKKKGK